MATLTFSKDAEAGGSPSAPTYVKRLKIICDTDYPAGGYSAGLSARTGFKDLGTSTKPLLVMFEGCTLAAYTAFYDRANDKIVIQTGGAEASTGANALDGAIFYFGVIYG